MGATAGLIDSQRVIGNHFAVQLVVEPRDPMPADGQKQDREGESESSGLTCPYCSEDKNGQKLRSAGELRRLVPALRQVYPDRQNFIQGTVFDFGGSSRFDLKSPPGLRFWSRVRES